MRTSEYLRSARAHLSDPKRWSGAENREGYNGKDGAACPVGACYVPLGTTYVDAEPDQDVAAFTAVHVLIRAIGLECHCDVSSPTDCDCIPNWNDRPERTHAEVLAAFDTAISYAEAAEQEFSPSACEPVTFDAMPMDLVRKALDSAPFTAEEHAAWVRAWEGI